MTKQNRALKVEFERLAEIERCERAVIDAADLLVCPDPPPTVYGNLVIAVMALRKAREA
jgi:hypothetical protein